MATQYVDLPAREDAPQQQNARRCKPEGIQSRRVIVLEEFNCSGKGHRKQGDGRLRIRGKNAGTIRDSQRGRFRHLPQDMHLNRSIVGLVENFPDNAGFLGLRSELPGRVLPVRGYSVGTPVSFARLRKTVLLRLFPSSFAFDLGRSVPIHRAHLGAQKANLFPLVFVRFGKLDADHPSIPDVADNAR